MPQNVFCKRKPVLDKRYTGLPSYVLKAIAATKIDGPEIEAIRTACEESKIVFDSPGVVGETVIHFAFPKYKTGLLIRSDSSTTYKSKESQCQNHGWALTTVSISELRRLSSEMIIAQFKEYITSLKTSRK